MARKKKSQKETPERSVELPAAEEQAPEAKAEEPKPERKMNIKDAARRFVAGYKEQWWPSIEKMARSESMGDEATEQDCKELFLKWGAKLR